MESIELTRHNIYYAGTIGVTRQVQTLFKKDYKGDYYGSSPKAYGFQNHCSGACGELVLAKWLGVFYDGCLDNINEYFRYSDVGSYQVRTTPYTDGKLILRTLDKENDVHILVLSHSAPVYHLAGWVYGHEGKLPEFLSDGGNGRRPAYFIPQGKLRSMDTLPKGE